MVFNRITSLQNAKVKKIAKLCHRKHRESTGLIRVEGLREISRAFEAGLVFQEVFVCHELIIPQQKIGLLDPRLFYKKWKKQDVHIWETTKAVFERMSFGDRMEGMIATCVAPNQTLSDLPAREKSFYVVIENVEKPGNLGAILRTCDGVGVDAVMVTDMQTDIYNLNVIRASLGTIFSLPVIQTTNEEVNAFFKKNHVKVLAALPQAKKDYTQPNYDRGIAVVVGNEQDGLGSFWCKEAEMCIRIPMKGKADSLNVSTATAVLLYEILRQREGN